MPEYKYFTEDEMRCHCGCGRSDMTESFMRKLVALRGYCDFPFNISSGFRCEAHNAKIGGAPKSMHLDGRAVDIKLSGKKAMHVLKNAEAFGFKGIGLKQKDGQHFVHLDDRKDLALWTY